MTAPAPAAAVCRTVADVHAAADTDSRTDPPLSQDQADYAAAAITATRQAAAPGVT